MLANLCENSEVVSSDFSMMKNIVASSLQVYQQN